MKAQQITKTELAKRMHTSRAALNRLLDDADPSLTLPELPRTTVSQESIDWATAR
jgi:antitoxin HicB